MTTPTVDAGPLGGPASGRQAPILPLLVFGFGAYLLWFSVKYWKGSGAAVWPSYPIRSVLQGQGVPSNISAASDASATLTAYETQTAASITGSDQASGSTGGGGTGSTGTGQAPNTTTAAGRGSAPAAPANVGGNVNLAKLMAGAYGWGTGAQWNALYALWERESGFSNTVWNKQGSGAYGIAQALPATKYPFAGQAAGGSSPKVQIAWGLAYIKARYGTPEKALAHEDAVGWY